MCRGDPIDLVEVDAGRQRMLTASGDLVKVWALKGHRVLKELRCESSQETFGFFAKHTSLLMFAWKHTHMLILSHTNELGLTLHCMSLTDGQWVLHAITKVVLPLCSSKTLRQGKLQ